MASFFFNWIFWSSKLIEKRHIRPLPSYFLLHFLSLSMGTHGVRFLRNFLQIFVFFTSLMMTLSVEYFCRCQPCNGFMWFRGSDINLLLSKSQWNVVKCQNSEITDIFCSVYEFDSFTSVSNLITRIVVNYRSSLQSLDLRFFRGDLRVFDFFGNTHREAHFWRSKAAPNSFLDAFP